MQFGYDRMLLTGSTVDAMARFYENILSRAVARLKIRLDELAPPTSMRAESFGAKPS